MRVKILGSAAGGGFPQWNCGCRNCNGVRNGTLKATPRTQTQIAVDANPEYAQRTHWALINASPEFALADSGDTGTRPVFFHA